MLIADLQRTVHAEDLKPTFDSRLSDVFDLLDKQNPCRHHHCIFPHKCIAMPDFTCEEPVCPALPSCVYVG
ncbi:hypothetical protein QR680_006204 [Steinernema hermaphroditum]|uniref:Uncharacterized protein n=1 Tax=Steinernema hermaphroditum TaxID=289476 RepID=A0AA39LWQ6_9BILA|nr:hypothetical protein QR680_006204 [Steinernema hermaphroditum]